MADVAAIEMRDDIGNDPDSAVGAVLHDAPIRILTEPLTTARARTLLDRMARG
jgi:hypothetical protein